MTQPVDDARADCPQPSHHQPGRTFNALVKADIYTRHGQHALRRVGGKAFVRFR